MNGAEQTYYGPGRIYLGRGGRPHGAAKQYPRPLQGESVEQYARRLQHLGHGGIIPFDEIHRRCQRRWRDIATENMKKMQVEVLM